MNTGLCLRSQHPWVCEELCSQTAFSIRNISGSCSGKHPSFFFFFPPIQWQTLQETIHQNWMWTLTIKCRAQYHDDPLGSRQHWDKEFKTEANPRWSSSPSQHRVRVMSKTNTKGATPHSVNTLSVAGMQEENHGVPLHCPQSEHYLPLYSRT